jgi:hypothetical protein
MCARIGPGFYPARRNRRMGFESLRACCRMIAGGVTGNIAGFDPADSEFETWPANAILAGSVIGNIPDADSGESRFDPWPASQSKL